MVFFSGDTHGRHTIHKFYNKNFPQQKELTKNDYVIILGDFGGIWNLKSNKDEISLLKVYKDRKFTTLFVAGNHENHNRLNSDEFPEVPMFGDFVKQINTNIFMLQTGHIYTIEGETYFVFGGADSIDKQYRKAYISWWPEEIPTTKTMMEALDLLKKVKKVDYILTHTTYTEMYQLMGFNDNKGNDPMHKFFDAVRNTVEYKYWLFGHFHVDKYNVNRKTFCLYNKIINKDNLNKMLETPIPTEVV